ncbi:MAG TPA: hypothetical protein PK771_12275, partial [Spirochaetota bacterium]|nr:hypothetical protein [Spirochaetota bacterium]
MIILIIIGIKRNIDTKAFSVSFLNKVLYNMINRNETNPNIVRIQLAYWVSISLNDVKRYTSGTKTVKLDIKIDVSVKSLFLANFKNDKKPEII